jgi:hypothetical protein
MFCFQGDKIVRFVLCAEVVFSERREKPSSKQLSSKSKAIGLNLGDTQFISQSGHPQSGLL